MIPCIVPARGGSKGLADKNLAMLGGSPLVAWPIRAALKAQLVSGTICSTDSSAIAAAALAAGAKCDRLRPTELAKDSTLVVDVLRHELSMLRQEGVSPSHLCLVQATSPFVTGELIDRAIALAMSAGYDVVCTGRSVGADHPDVVFAIDELTLGARWVTEAKSRSRRRQDGVHLFVRSGLVYVFRVEHLEACGDDYFSGTTGCIAVDSIRANSIDTQLDLEWCRFLLENCCDQLGIEDDLWAEVY